LLCFNLICIASDKHSLLASGPQREAQLYRTYKPALRTDDGILTIDGVAVDAQTYYRNFCEPTYKLIKVGKNFYINGLIVGKTEYQAAFKVQKNYLKKDKSSCVLS